jgi:uncharacterized protein
MRDTHFSGKLTIQPYSSPYMQKTSSGILLSATDLSFFLGCNHASWLNLQEVHGLIKAPPLRFDASLKALQDKGQEFEAEYIEKLKSTGIKVATINKADAREETIRAMKEGVDIIYQARLEYDVWVGWADFLVKVDKPSIFGGWSYEVEDTKFARETKAGAILQICLYSYMLGNIQGFQPEYMYIKTPEERQPYRVDDYIAYFRLMQRKLLAAISQNTEVTYPHPVEQCAICRWWLMCNDRRRKDDHLGFIAGMGAAQIKEVGNWHVNTLRQMAELPLPLPFDPLKGSTQTFTKLREQARVQLQSREEKRNIYELLPLEVESGLYQLPEPSDGDIFFDFEGDPFIGTCGREYLFGWVHKKGYQLHWATNDSEEKHAFESFIDMVMDIWKEYPGMHIYHYSAYEPSAIKRLMGRYATRENEVDRLLRANVFIDLHTITRHTIRAGVEAYSLKELEKFHNFNRDQDLQELKTYKALFEGLLETENADAIDEKTKQVVADYNKEDCLSAESLRDWLETLRQEYIQKGHAIPRPESKSGDASDNITAHQERIKPIYERLMAGVSFEKKDRSVEDEAKWLLANMLDWYRREKKSYWWNYFRLLGLAEEELILEKDAIAGLIFTGRVDKVNQSEVHFYSFPAQEYEFKESKDLAYKEMNIGRLETIDQKNLTVGIRKNNKLKHIHPTYVIVKNDVPDKPKEESIIRLAEHISNHGLGTSPYQPASDLLLKNPPRVICEVHDTSDAQQKAVQWVSQLNNSVLPIQGPPGTGKSHTAAQMIVSLISQGKKIGITALSHKVISGLLYKVVEAAQKSGVTVTIIQKVTGVAQQVAPNWNEIKEYPDVLGEISNSANVIAGTAYMWAREDFANTVDVLFVDEAGQLSLIDTLAVSQAGKNLVLLGDPQQLQQPQKGQHPEGTEVSALAHLLDGRQTISPDKGVFLDRTWRMHPSICNYISELFYDSKLTPHEANANQQLRGNTIYATPGIYVHRVQHENNTNRSDEEVMVVKNIVRDLLNNEVYYTDRNNESSRLHAACIKIITPYNAQVNALLHAVPEVQTGTVDKFQGQEAQVIIFSMATSSPEDAPRGMEFLYSLNRLNVAVSRARTVFILVACGQLFEPGCRSPRHMKLANALCRLIEKANVIS